MIKTDIKIELDAYDVDRINYAMELAYQISSLHDKSEVLNVFERVAGMKCGDILYDTVVRRFNQRVTAQLESNA